MLDLQMITGDQLLIGKETAKQLGMGLNFFTTEELVKVCALVGMGRGKGGKGRFLVLSLAVCA